MAKDIQGLGLALASRFAGSRWAEKYGLRKPAQRLAYLSTRSGFRLAGQLSARRHQPSTSTANDARPAAAQNADSRSASLFDLSLSEEQNLIRSSVRAYAGDILRPAAAAANEQGQPPQAFHQRLMSELGLGLFSVPEHLGGSAPHYSPVTSALIAEDLAWGDFSLAVTALAPLAVANAIVRWGNPAQQQRWLPQWLQETPPLAAIAVQEPGPLFTPGKLTTHARASRKGFQLDGEKTLVPLASSAALFLTAAVSEGRPALFLVPADSRGVQVSPRPAMGLKAAVCGTVTFSKVTLDADARLDDGHFCYADFISLGQLHWCALAVGTCQAALDYLLPYCNERRAFGEPISQRQSVAFMLADMAIEVDAMRLLTWRAAARAEQRLPFRREAFLAHTLCSEKAMQIATNAVQLLGGHGFTKEHPAERWYRDLRSLTCISSGLHL